MKVDKYLLLVLAVFLLYTEPVFGQAGKKLSFRDFRGILQQGKTCEIIGDVNLKGGTLEIPEGIKLKFNGGKLRNGAVVFNHTELEGDICIEGDFKGTITNGEINASWFGLKAGCNSDQTKALQSIISLYESNVPFNSWDINLNNPEPTIIIPAGKYNVGEIILRSYVTIKGAGRGSTELYGTTFKADKQFNITIEDLSIVGNSGGNKNPKYNLEDSQHQSAFKFSDCGRLIFKNVCVKSYDVAFDMYNTYLADFYSCFVSYCNVGYMNGGKGKGHGGHAVRWFGGELCSSVYGFVQTSGNGVLLEGVTFENCCYGIDFIAPVSFTVDACYFEGNNYDVAGNILHVSVENCFFSESGKEKGGAYIYASTSIGYANFHGNKFGNTVFGNPHIMVADTAKVYSNITIGQNYIVNGGRIPVSDRLLPYIKESGANTFQTYLPNGKNLLMGQTVVYKNPKTGRYYLVTRDTEGDLLFSPLSREMQ